jgi:hypothetical protein
VSVFTAKPMVGLRGETGCRVTGIAALQNSQNNQSGDASPHSKTAKTTKAAMPRRTPNRRPDNSVRLDCCW